MGVDDRVLYRAVCWDLYLLACEACVRLLMITFNRSSEFRLAVGGETSMSTKPLAKMSGSDITWKHH